MCIYYGNRDELTYNGQEHVIPAALGCHTKLANGMVSDQANSYFSSIECRVLEKSLINIVRMIVGPGKRGSLSEKKASTSGVSVICVNGKMHLGYMKQTKAYILNQIIIYIDDSQEKLQYVQGRDPIKDTGDLLDTCEANILALFDELNNWNGRYVYLHIDNDITLITYYDGRVYIAAKEKPDERFVILGSS